MQSELAQLTSGISEKSSRVDEVVVAYNGATPSYHPIESDFRISHNKNTLFVGFPPMETSKWLCSVQGDLQHLWCGLHGQNDWAPPSPAVVVQGICEMFVIKDGYGGFHRKMGGTHFNGLFMDIWKIPSTKLMTGGTPILGNLHMDLFQDGVPMKCGP